MTHLRSALEPLIVVFLAIVITVISISPAIDAGYVYDDHRQIEENELIRNPDLLGSAMLSDVWAFKGDRDEAWSGYWRPTFVAWLAACYHLFGPDNPTGWRVANALLNGLVTGLVWLLLLRLGAGRGIAWSVALLFAAHPVHVESVAWISGSPDLLAAAFSLICLLAILAAAETRSTPRAILAWLAGALALLSKEAAIGLPILAAAILWWRPTDTLRSTRQRIVEVFRYAVAPGAVLIAAYLAARAAVLGTVFGEPPVQLSLVEIGLAAVRALAFYLRQSLLPFNIAPAYGFRATIPDASPISSTLVPVLAVVAAVVVALFLARRSHLAAIGSSIFLICLAPALKVDAFLPDHIVHDRYLYLAVMGPLLVVAVAAARALGNRRTGSNRVHTVAAVAVAVVTVLLVLQSRKAAECWSSDLRMWQCSVANDPSSAYNRAQLANTLLDEGRLNEALAEAERSLVIAPATTAYLVRAEVSISNGNPAQAIEDLQAVVASLPDHAPAWERLAMAYHAAGDLASAESTLRTARLQAPWRSCSLTANLAVILVLQERPGEALTELQGILDSTENTRVCRMAPLYAARLEVRRGRLPEAEALLMGYLARSEIDTDDQSEAQRREAMKSLDLIRNRMASSDSEP